MNKGKKAVMIGSLLALSLMVGCSSQSATDAGKRSTSSSSPSSASSGQVAETNVQDIFQQTCAGCHGQNLEGAVGPSLQKIGSKMNENQILEVITKGRGQMPRGLVPEEEAKKLAAWLAAKK
jgi:cytochrome c551